MMQGANLLLGIFVAMLNSDNIAPRLSLMTGDAFKIQGGPEEANVRKRLNL